MGPRRSPSACSEAFKKKEREGRVDEFVRRALDGGDGSVVAGWAAYLDRAKVGPPSLTYLGARRQGMSRAHVVEMLSNQPM